MAPTSEHDPWILRPSCCNVEGSDVFSAPKGRRYLIARIFIVEDDTPLRVALVRFLTSHGHSVAAESSAGDARWAVERSQPDLLIAAVHLPGVDGEAFAKEVHARRMTLPVILMISQSFHRAPPGGSSAQLIWRISKPFSAPTLLQTVQAALEDQRLEEVAK